MIACSRKVCVVLFVLLLLLGTFSFAASSSNVMPGLPTEYCTAIVGTDLTFHVDANVVSVESSRADIAAAFFDAGELKIVPSATGDTTVTVTQADGNAETFDIYVYASQAEYEYLQTVFQGKTFSVLGDSISTLEPWDDGGASRYFDFETVANCGLDSGLVNANGENKGGIPIRRRDTYWGNLQTRFDMTLGNLVSWRGKTVIDWMESDAQIHRLGKNGTPDVIFFNGGSNDILKKKALDDYCAAYDTVLTKLGADYPDATILALLPCAPSGNAPYNAAAMELCELHHVEYVNLAASGVKALHPDADGFSKEVGYILDTLYANERSRLADAQEPVTQEAVTDAPTTKPTVDAPTAPKLNFFQRLLAWLRTFFAHLFGR